MVQLKKGFTLVELIGVIAVLGIILLVTIPTLTSTLRSNSDQKYENTLQDIYLATEQYTLNYKEQFPSLEQIGGSAMVTIETLKNAVKYNHISHAYLFSGPRGTGKTTIAKIFARAVNCLEPVDGLACGKCKNCNYSFSNECMDIIEIDAASNNGVDEIRELRNKVNILPSELKYKVYIIDEVHMLSIGAFNALLKTIEEPPSHVIFILATTDP